jgi:hypothetical protein
MNDEKIINVAPDENPAQPNHHESENPSTRSLVGKIARLPNDLREQVNQRLLDGGPLADILAWLNQLPAVKEVLAAKFGGQAINHQNLSNWRQGGYQDWLKEQKSLARLQRASQYASKISGAAHGRIADGASALISCQILELFDNADSGQLSPGDLAKMAFAVSALRTADQNQVRLKYEQTRVFQGNERLVLSWDKFLRDRISIVQRALNDAIAKDIQAADIDNGEKIELLGYEMFGKKWQGREIPVPEPPPSNTKVPKNSKTQP